MKGLPAKDFVGEVVALNRFVRDDIRYVHDVIGVETIATPEATLQLGQGDCDDKATLLAALGMTLGKPASFVVIWRNGDAVHVWTRLKPHAQAAKWEYIDCETTESSYPTGRAPTLRAGDRQIVYDIKPFKFAR